MLLLLASLVALGIYFAWPSTNTTGHATPKHPAKEPVSHRRRSYVPLSLGARVEAWRLPAAVSREAVLADGSGLTVIGGLDASGNSLSGVENIDLASGAVTSGPALATPVHDASAAGLADGTFVFGGGSPTTVATVQPVGPGTVPASALPQPRSDSATVVLSSGVRGGGAPTAYVVGGYTGLTYLGEVLATSDGQRFATVANLPVPVRYAAVATYSGRIYVFGGEVAAPGPNVALTNDIQMVDPATHSAAVVGHLPEALYGSAAFSFHSALYVAGGDAANGATLTRISLFEPSSHEVLDAGSLPQGEAFGGYTTVGSGAAAVGYIVGGEVTIAGQNTVSLATVMSLRPNGAAPARPETA